MPRYYLKSGQKEALHGFKTGDWSKSEAIDNHNENILADLYNKLLTGQISAFYQRTKDNKHLIIAHKSTRPGVIIQVSHNWIINGEIIPCSHDNINSFSDLLKKHPFYTSEYLKEFTA